MPPDPTEDQEESLTRRISERAQPPVVAEPSTASNARTSHSVEGLHPSHYGRFIVLRTLGTGGMGVVLSAYDERLDRRVAIKVLRAGSEWRARVLQEARALARLSHPNVVQVYEVGEDAGDLFIVMEHVDGGTLSQWRKNAEYGWEAVVERFAAAGRGLAAAHAVGLVHRDFKPANVLLGGDGRVCVADFGIASVDPLHPSSTADDSSPSAAYEALAQPDEVVGTPAYMAPEQLAGSIVDARSDQFSFCVALYEALFRERPFEGRTLAELQRNVLAGRRLPLPRGIHVPAHVIAVLERGLQLDPLLRWPSMNHLLRALADDPRQRRRRRLATVLGLGVLGVAAWGYREVLRREYAGNRSARDQMCQGSLAAFDAVWGELPRERVRAAMLATARPFSAAVWHDVEARLDAYAERWHEQHGQACEATGRGTQSEAMLDLRLSCLATRRQAVSALIDELSEADAAAAQRAPRAAASLPTLDACADLPALTGESRRQVALDDAARQGASALEELRARTIARFELGRYETSRALADELLARAQALPHPSFVAWARYELGRLHQRLGEGERGLELLRSAWLEADALGDDALRLDVAQELTHLEGVERGDRDAGLRWGEQAQAVLTRLGPLDARRRAGVLHNLATVHGHHGDPALARTLLEEALDLHQRDPDDYLPARASTLADLGLAHAMLGQPQAARDRIQAAIGLIEQTLGPEHPELVSLLVNLMSTQHELGELEAAAAAGERGLALAKASLGPEHPLVGKTMINLATVMSDRGRHADAIAYQRDAIAILERAYGPEDPNLVVALSSAAAEEGRFGDLSRARTLYERALAVASAAHGPDHPALVLPLQGLANVDLRQGRVASAREGFVRAIAIQRQHPIPEELAPLLLTLASVELEAERPADAEPLLREASELCATPASPYAYELLGAAKEGLAKLERARGQGLAAVEPRVREAEAAFVAAGDGGHERLAALRAWWQQQQQRGG